MTPEARADLSKKLFAIYQTQGVSGFRKFMGSPEERNRLSNWLDFSSFSKGTAAVAGVWIVLSFKLLCLLAVIGIFSSWKFPVLIGWVPIVNMAGFAVLFFVTNPRSNVMGAVWLLAAFISACFCHFGAPIRLPLSVFVLFGCLVCSFFWRGYLWAYADYYIRREIQRLDSADEAK